MIFFMCSLAIPAHGHQGNSILPVYEFPPAWLPDLHDGSVRDWEDALPGPSFTSFDLLSVRAAAYQTPDPFDLSVRGFLGWSFQEQRLYIAVERIDDVYVNTYPVPEDPRGAFHQHARP